MSIINDALKKVQADIEKTGPKKTTPVSSGGNPAEPPKSIFQEHPTGKETAPMISEHRRTIPPRRKQKWPRRVLLLTLFILCGLALFFALDKTNFVNSPLVDYINSEFIALTSPEPEQRPEPEPEPEFTQELGEEDSLLVAEEEAPALEPTPVAFPVVEAPDPDQIIIGGIITMDDKNVALINDGIYEVGNTVNGMKIINISLDKVQMLKDGETKTFVVTNR